MLTNPIFSPPITQYVILVGQIWVSLMWRERTHSCILCAWLWVSPGNLVVKFCSIKFLSMLLAVISSLAGGQVIYFIVQISYSKPATTVLWPTLLSICQIDLNLIMSNSALNIFDNWPPKLSHGPNALPIFCFANSYIGMENHASQLDSHEDLLVSKLSNFRPFQLVRVSWLPLPLLCLCILEVSVMFVFSQVQEPPQWQFRQADCTKGAKKPG